MISFNDEGFTDGDLGSRVAGLGLNADHSPSALFLGHEDLSFLDMSIQEREELAYALLSSLPRSRLVNIHRRISPLLQLDIIGLLPTELSLEIFSYFPWETLLACSLVSRRWRTLAEDSSLWKGLCAEKGWQWKQPPSRAREFLEFENVQGGVGDDDEGMGDEEDEHDDRMRDHSTIVRDPYEELFGIWREDSGFVSSSMNDPSLSNVEDLYDYSPYTTTPTALAFPSSTFTSSSSAPTFRSKFKSRYRHSAPPHLPSSSIATSSTLTLATANKYKLLYFTRTRLHNRFLCSSYRLSTLQSRVTLTMNANGEPIGIPTNNGHTNTIYCLQLYTYPETGQQVLFTGSKDKTIREWSFNLGSRKGEEKAGRVERVLEGVHESSVLSVCVGWGHVASAGSDRRVGLWDLATGEVKKVLMDHEDSVLCVRFDGKRLLSCSKDRTVRTYTFPDLKREFVLGGHRAAVNAVSISGRHIVSASGDRSMRLWDAETGHLLHIFENHHSRGIASIDFSFPYVLSGSSDKHLRFYDIVTGQGWSTSPDLDTNPPPSIPCQACGSSSAITWRREHPHSDLVRSVALGEDFVISGSYDLSIKVWNKKTGVLVADLTGGHSGRIFCVGFDCTKIVSCGEDQRICIWDFSHGIDTSFIQL